MTDPVWHAYDPDNRDEGVLVIYTGGTIGSVPRDPGQPGSPLVVVDWREFRRRTSSLSPALPDGRPNPRYIGFNVDGCSLRPVDSSNIGPAEWTEIARIVAESHDTYEGFVVLHGTDTMVYTASALSFMLEHLARPVVLTGALVPHLRNVRNDALQNLLTSLQIAHPRHSGLPVVPEVAVYFNNLLLRGNRSRKVHASGFDAFRSVNYPPLATAGERIVVHRQVVRQVEIGRRLRLRSLLEPRVAMVIVFPGIQDSPILLDLLGDPSLRGLVLLVYGSGTVPSQPGILTAIESAVRRGVVAVAVTQTGGGHVDLERYDASIRLLEAGVVGGADMTAEAALTKLMVLLGDPDLSTDEVRALVQRDLAGEQSLNVYVTPCEEPDGRMLGADVPVVRLEAHRVAGHGREPEATERAVVRLRGAAVRTAGDGAAAVRVAVDALGGAPGTCVETAANLLPGRGGDRRMVVIDVTESFRSGVGPRVFMTLGLVDPGGTSLEWESAELALSLREAR